MNLLQEKVNVAIPYSLLRVELNPLTLAFTGNQAALEQPFLKVYFTNSLDHLRRCKLYAIIFFSIFGALDPIVFPEQLYSLWFIRYAIVCPVFRIAHFPYSIHLPVQVGLKIIHQLGLEHLLILPCSHQGILFRNFEWEWIEFNR